MVLAFPANAAQSSSGVAVRIPVRETVSGVTVRIPVREAAGGGTVMLESEDGDTQQLRLSAGRSGVFTIRLTAVGNYEYIVFQDASDSGTVMDETIYHVDIMISRNDSGNLTSAAVIERDDEKTEEITFANKAGSSDNSEDSSDKPDSPDNNEKTPDAAQGKKSSDSAANAADNAFEAEDSKAESVESMDETSVDSRELVQESHHTGDTPDIMIWSALLAASAAAVMLIVCTERRSGKSGR